MDYSSAMVSGVPLVLVVLGLVEWIKSFNITGNWLRIASLATGLVFGGGYMLMQGFPADFSGWFQVIVYGLGLGLVSSGVYDAAKSIKKA